MRLAPFPTVYAPAGMTCAVDHLAASAGTAMLRTGGSAADAAIAASAVLAVTTQHMCGMGGDLFALVHDGSSVHALSSNGWAGSGADADRLRAEGHVTMPFRGDIRTVPVPGCVDGWVALHERFGRLPLADVLAPAHRYAAEGYTASTTFAAAVTLLPPEAAAAAFDLGGATGDGGRLRPGDVVRRPGAARTLAAIAEGGRDAFYSGEFGAGLLELGAGEYVLEDLAEPLARWTDPVRLDAWGHGIWTVPPPSQGYLALTSAWIADGLPLPDADDPGWAHLLIEASRQAAFDRDDVLHEHAEPAALVAPDRLARRRDAIRPEAASDVGDHYRPGGTIYLCAVDADGRGVSLIQSNAAGFGSHLVEPRTGIALQNRGLGFNLMPGHPAEYGPRRRPPHTLSPTLVTRTDGSLRAVVGSMGGDAQPQIVLQLLARLLRGGESPGSIIAAPRWALASGDGGFETWGRPGRLRVQLEAGTPASWADGLRSRGHVVEEVDAFGHGFGHSHLIERLPGGGLAGASDPRARGGAAAGV